MIRARTRLYVDNKGRLRTADIVGGDFFIDDPKGFWGGSFANVECDSNDNFAYIIEEDVSSVMLTGRELDTVLAALRLLQCQGGRIPDDLAEIATNGGEHTAMDADEIDNLCEYLNE